MTGIAIVWIVAIAVVMLVLRGAQKGGRILIQEALAQALGGKVTEDGASGRAHGVDVAVRFETRGSGSSRESWTYHEAALPPGYPFALYVRVHGWLDAGRIEAGTMVDLQLGDAPFDARFLVEGAPEEVVRRLLGPSARATLLAESSQLELQTHGAILRYAVRGWADEAAPILARIELAAAIAGGLRAATLALDDEVPLSRDGDAYRGIPDDRAQQEARAQRAAEVEKIGALQQRRAANAQRYTIVFVVGIVALVVILMSR